MWWLAILRVLEFVITSRNNGSVKNGDASVGKIVGDIPSWHDPRIPK